MKNLKLKRVDFIKLVNSPDDRQFYVLLTEKETAVLKCFSTYSDYAVFQRKRDVQKFYFEGLCVSETPERETLESLDTQSARPYIYEGQVFTVFGTGSNKRYMSGDLETCLKRLQDFAESEDYYLDLRAETQKPWEKARNLEKESVRLKAEAAKAALQEKLDAKKTARLARGPLSKRLQKAFKGKASELRGKVMQRFTGKTSKPKTPKPKT